MREWIANDRGLGYQVSVNDDMITVNGATFRCPDADGFVAVVRWLVALPDTLTRDRYEAECVKHGIAPTPDADLGDYADKYGDYDFPTYFAPAAMRPTGVELTLRQRRWAAIRAAAPVLPRPAAPAGDVVPTGQLWEPCEQCGREPVYMPLHLCDSCWPTR